MKILIGTTNPSKIKLFAGLLDGCGVTFLTLNDLQIDGEPEEKGSTPEENAILKAKYYGRFFDPVLCNDAGLYFDELPLDDARQPGLHVRTPGGGKRLDDEEMIAYYSRLIRSLGGRTTAYYMDGIAVYRQGRIYSFSGSAKSSLFGTFLMVDHPSDKRHPGWPLDSISMDRSTQQYFVGGINEGRDTKEESAAKDAHLSRLKAFLKEALGIR